MPHPYESHEAEVPGSSAEMSQELRPSQWPAEAGAPDGDDRGYDSTGVWETYGCRAGSMVVFAEALRHTGSDCA